VSFSLFFVAFFSAPFSLIFFFTQYQPRSFWAGAFLPRDSVHKDFDLEKEGVSFGRCQIHRRLSNDLADGQSGCKQPPKGDSVRLNQACKKEVLLQLFFLKEKLRNGSRNII
jgi:hypothetical protein